MTAEVDGELIGLSVARGTCYGLDGVGTRIWALLAEPRSFDSLCQQLCAEFDVEARQCRDDVAELVAELRSERLVRVATGE